MPAPDFLQALARELGDLQARLTVEYTRCAIPRDAANDDETCSQDSKRTTTSSVMPGKASAPTNCLAIIPPPTITKQAMQPTPSDRDMTATASGVSMQGGGGGATLAPQLEHSHSLTSSRAGGGGGAVNNRLSVTKRMTVRQSSRAFGGPRDEEPPFMVHELWGMDEDERILVDSTEDDDDHAFKEDDDEDFHQNDINRSRHCSLMIEPQCRSRMFWDWCGFCLIAYDAIVIPLSFFDPPMDAVTFVASWVSRIFWSADMVLSFFTGFINTTGKVEMRFLYVAKHYVKTWLLVDCFIVLSNWLEVVNMMNLARTMRSMRVFRALRLLRLMRLAVNAKEMSSSFTYRVRSEQVMIVLGIVKIMVIIIALMHVFACCWYGIKAFDEVNWVVFYQLEDASLALRYGTSFHWALTQFVGSADIAPKNHIERAFAINVLLMAFVISAYVVSSITTSMTRLQILTAHHSKQLSVLRRYLNQNNISSRLAARVLRNAQHIIAEQKRNISENNVELLEFISLPLRVELRFEANAHIIERHPFFRCYSERNPAAMRQICYSAVTWLSLTKGDVLFSENEKPQDPAIYFVLNGDLIYSRKGTAAATVAVGGWAGEPVLWTDWVYQGNMRAATECELLLLNAKMFRTIAHQYRTLNFFPAHYAKEFIDRLNECRKNHCYNFVDVDDDEVNAVSVACSIFPELKVIIEKRTSVASEGFNAGKYSMFGIRESAHRMSGFAGRASGAGSRRQTSQGSHKENNFTNSLEIPAAASAARPQKKSGTRLVVPTPP